MGGLMQLLSSALGGGLVGAIASSLNKVMDNRKDIKVLELNLQHDKDMSQHEAAMAKMQLDSQQALASVDAEVRLGEADYRSLEASMEADQARYANVDTTKTSKWFVLVDFIRGIMRPVITSTLTVYLIVVTFYSFATYGVTFESHEVAAMTFAVVDAMTTCASLSLSWWFGSRSHARKG